MPNSFEATIYLPHLPIMSIPSEQYAQIYKSNNDPILYKKVLVLKPGLDEVLINIKYTGGQLLDLIWFDSSFRLLILDPSLPYPSSRKSPSYIAVMGSY